MLSMILCVTTNYRKRPVGIGGADWRWSCWTWGWSRRKWTKTIAIACGTSHKTILLVY